MFYSLQPYRLYSPWNSPGQNTGVGSRSLFQGIFPTQGSNPGLLHCRRVLYQLSHQGSPRILEWVAFPFSSKSSRPWNPTGITCIAGGFFTSWATREAHLKQWNQLADVWAAEFSPAGGCQGPSERWGNSSLPLCSSWGSCFRSFFRERFPLFQIEARGTLDGEEVEHQRTTFVKQLKLGKVSLHCPPGQLCLRSTPDPALLWGPRVPPRPSALSLSAAAAPAVPVHPPPAAELVQPRHAPEEARARAVRRVPDDGHLQVPPPGAQAQSPQPWAARAGRARAGAAGRAGSPQVRCASKGQREGPSGPWWHLHSREEQGWGWEKEGFIKEVKVIEWRLVFKSSTTDGNVTGRRVEGCFLIFWLNNNWLTSFHWTSSLFCPRTVT